MSDTTRLFGPGGALGPEVFAVWFPWLLGVALVCFAFVLILPVVWAFLDLANE